jgi:NTE family protein
MKKMSLLFSLLVMTGSVAFPATAPAHRPRIGLVLSGGGARGAAHVGVLKVLEELRIPVDYIAGTSMGSAVGGLYASGLSSQELFKVFQKFDWDAAFNDSPPRSERSYRRKQDDQNSLVKYRLGIGADGIKFPRGAVEGQNFVTELRKLGHITQNIPSFDQLPTPFRALASDIVSGESVVLSSGDLAMAIRASVAIAPLFSPVEYQGRLLSDGGYLNNIPVNVVRDMGADEIIVINIGTPLAKRDQIRSVMDVMSQTGRLGGERFDREQKALIGKKDILIEPDLTGLSFVDFARVPEMIDRGEAKAREMIDQLKKYSVSEAEYATWKAQRKGIQPWPVIQAVEMHNYSKIDSDILQPFITQPIGKPLDPVALQKDLGGIYGLGYFEYVDYNVVTSSAGVTTLVINAPRKSWGPDYLRFGVSFSDDFNGSSQYLLGARYTMTELNKMGGEFQSDLGIGTNSRLALEYYQPFLYGKRRFDRGAAYFITPVFGATRSTEDLIADGQRALQFRINRYDTGADLGRQISNWAELRGGFRRSFATGDLRVGLPPGGFNVNDLDDAYARAIVRYDTLDKVSFPTHGGIGGIEWRKTVQNLGTDFDYQSLDVSMQQFMPWKKNTVAARGVYSTNLDRQTDRPRPYNLGGFLFLSGFKDNELVGTDRVLAQLQDYYEMGKVAGAPWYLGVIGEAGGIWMGEKEISLNTARASGSVFLGVDSFFGPMYLAYTLASGGNNSAAFLLGARY